MRKNHRKNRSILPFLTVFCGLCLLEVVRIYYAMKTLPGVNLYTGNGLPVAPFSLPVN
ncbi:MAG: hypothetical protein IJZ13_07505 [Clostridia bacterium]|nr:hypothetical protein [Clostridia bacterium]